MKKTILLILILLFHINNIMAEDVMYTKGIIYLNNNEIIAENTVLFENEYTYMPLRAIFEAIGAEVIWQEDTGNVLINYLNESYICELETVKKYNFITVKNVKYIDSMDNDNYIQLNPMSADGEYIMVSDRIYLHQETGIRLFEAFGFSVKIDSKHQILYLTSGTQK